MSDPLPPDLADAVDAAASPRGRALRLHYFAEVESTNDVALRLAEAGAPDGTAVVADGQRAGRGRRGRSWFSPPGAGLYLSCIVRGGVGSTAFATLTLAAGVAVARAVTAIAGLPVELKWPNDVVTGRPWRKLAGILCESTGVGPRLDAVVVGIGVNLRAASYPPELAARATSIELELGRPVDRGALAVECLAQLIAVAGRWRDAGGTEAILNEWRRLGQPGLEGAGVSWREQGTERRGRARGIDADGALLVERAGAVERIIASEVTWDRTN